MLTGLGKVLENFDLIGKTINFRIDKSSSIKTSCGGVSTMIIIFILFCIFFIFVIPFMNRLDPDVTYYFMKEVAPKRYNLNNENFFLGYSLNYANGDLLSDDDSNLFKITLRNFFKYKNQDGKKNPEFPKFSNQSNKNYFKL